MKTVTAPFPRHFKIGASRCPLGRKIPLVLRNTWLKIRNRSDCCGNYGEPGC